MRDFACGNRCDPAFEWIEVAGQAVGGLETGMRCLESADDSVEEIAPAVGDKSALPVASERESRSEAG